MSSKVIITGKHSQDNIERFRKLPSASVIIAEKVEEICTRKCVWRMSLGKECLWACHT